MSVNPASRPRKASRVPLRLGDENGAAATAALVPRIMSKTGLASLGTTRVGKPALAVSAAPGKPGLSVVTAGARRALGDVSNAARPVSLADKTGKEAVVVKPTRSRTVSASSASATAIGTGFSRLKIGSTAAVAVAKPVRPTSAVSTAELKAALASKASTQSLRQEERFPQVGRPGSSTAAQDLAVLHERSLDGLGFKSEDGQDWTADEMYGAAPSENAMSIDSAPTSLKRDHVRALSSDAEEEDEAAVVGSKVRIVEGDLEDPDDWLAANGLSEVLETDRQMNDLRETFDEQLDFWDTTMVAEYSEEIFHYMSELEEKAMPNPRYMDHQTEIEWSMRTTLIDWLLQVHMRYHMLPETLWIAINIVDRFLSNRVVSLVKFQLVGVTAMFIAAKYEEIMAPSVDEFVYMTEKGYTKDEIIKGERIILQSLEFNVSPYCSPYSWVRRISKADDYDIQTRTLSKFLMEVTLLDHRFLRAKPSMIAAIGMYLARRMLGGEWNDAFIYYSNYTEAQLVVPTGFLLESIAEADFQEKFVYKKYANKKFLKASVFARNWAKTNTADA